MGGPAYVEAGERTQFGSPTRGLARKTTGKSVRSRIGRGSLRIQPFLRRFHIGIRCILTRKKVKNLFGGCTLELETVNDRFSQYWAHD